MLKYIKIVTVNLVLTLIFFLLFLASLIIFKNEIYESLIDIKADKAVLMKHGNNILEYIELGKLFTSDSFLKKNTTARHSLKENGNLIYDVQYKTDQFGRRNMFNNKRSKFIILAGCSFVFGIGLQSEETLPALLSPLSGKYTVYNYGIPGAGTNHVLSKIESNTLSQEISQNEGLYIYVYIDGHISRSLGEIGPVIRKDAPHYKWVNNDPIRDGTFFSAEPVWTWFREIILKSWLSGYIAIENINYFSSNSISKICSMIKKSQVEFNKQFPTSEFIVFFHPAESESQEELSNCLQKAQVHYFSADYIHDDSLLLPVDRHPNLKGNLKTARSIMNYIDSGILGEKF